MASTSSSSITTTTTSRLSCEEMRKIKVVLLQGQKSAKQLQILLLQLHNNPDQPPGLSTAAHGFVNQILTSFTQTIHRIIDHHPNKSKKRSTGTSTTSLMMDKRGCYKRRRCSETKTKVSPTMEDGQSWRKYGQKVILNSNFPRSYFRCSHKYDQGCKAAKQVQIMEDNPKLYQTTYIGFHTCTSLKPAPTPTLFFSFSSSKTPSYNNNNNNQQNVAVAAVKDEEEEEEHNSKEQHDTMSDLTDNLNSSSSFAHLHIDDMDHNHMYTFPPAFDDITSQFDHPDFKIIDDFFSPDNNDHHPFTPHLYNMYGPPV